MGRNYSREIGGVGSMLCRALWTIVRTLTLSEKESCWRVLSRRVKLFDLHLNIYAAVWE